MFLRALPPPTRRIFARLGRKPFLRGFYLAGGSAAALHLGHRVSMDLDFFTPEPFSSVALISGLRTIGALTVQQQKPDTLVALLGRSRVSFFQYPYALLEPAAVYRGLRIASLLDIALMKIIAISQRGRRRDFVDLYAISRAHYTLQDLLRRLPEKYPTISYPSYHLLRALAHFEDADKDPPLQTPADYAWGKVKAFFTKKVGELARRM
jgi:hypothetical protein